MLVLIFRMVSDQTNIDGGKGNPFGIPIFISLCQQLFIGPRHTWDPIYGYCIVLTLDNTSAFPNSSLTHCQYPESKCCACAIVFFIIFVSHTCAVLWSLPRQISG